MNKLYGKGILKSMQLVTRHFIDSYLVDLRQLFQHKTNQEKLAYRASSQSSGLFTVEYPEVKLQVPEAFRFLPFLVFDLDQEGEQIQRCTACGSCARVCPPQCIWIERNSDPETGKPLRSPASFSIDTDLCMNCGLCAENCPFDAIIMDHIFELASTTRKDHVLDLQALSKPASYYQQIKPEQVARISAAKKEKNNE